MRLFEVWVNTCRLVKRGQRLLGLSHLKQCRSKVVMRDRVAWPQRQRASVLRDRFIETVGSCERGSVVEIRGRRFGLQLQRGLEMRYCFGWPVQLHVEYCDVIP